MLDLCAQAPQPAPPGFACMTVPFPTSALSSCTADLAIKLASNTPLTIQPRNVWSISSQAGRFPFAQPQPEFLPQPKPSDDTQLNYVFWVLMGLIFGKIALFLLGAGFSQRQALALAPEHEHKAWAPARALSAVLGMALICLAEQYAIPAERCMQGDMECWPAAWGGYTYAYTSVMNLGSCFNHGVFSRVMLFAGVFEILSLVSLLDTFVKRLSPILSDASSMCSRCCSLKPEEMETVIRNPNCFAHCRDERHRPMLAALVFAIVALVWLIALYVHPWV